MAQVVQTPAAVASVLDHRFGSTQQFTIGVEEELEGVREILARGNGADCQLRVWNANRDVVEVATEIADLTEERPD